MSFEEMLARCSRVNRRVEDEFFARFHVNQRRDDVRLAATILVWSVNTPEGRLAVARAELAEE